MFLEGDGMSGEMEWEAQVLRPVELPDLGITSQSEPIDRGRHFVCFTKEKRSDDVTSRI